MRAASTVDAADSARLHIAFLRHGFFPRLGPRFVRKWPAAHQDFPYGAHFVAEVDGRVAVSSWAPSTSTGTRELDARAPPTRAYGRRTERDADPADGVRRFPPHARRSIRPAVAVLEAVVINPFARGLGAGSLLVESFLDLVAARGATRVELVTKVGPEGAAEFYEERGWSKVDEHVDRDGDPALTYRIDARQRPTKEQSATPEPEAS